jgi:hypothetical protein
MRLKRMDTGEAVIAAITREQIGHPSPLDGDVQWRPASAPRTLDGEHYVMMGFVRRSWPADQINEHLLVISRNWRGYRGWGFSKLVGPSQKQTYSWDGHEIPKTIFEIATTASDLSEDESRLLITDDTKIGLEPMAMKIARRQTSIRGLTVSKTGSGAMLGGTVDLIMTAIPGPARDDAPVVFITPVGDQMKAVLDDVLRSIRLKYPRWEVSKVELTFDDRVSKMDGPSIGAALGTEVLSMLEGFEIDPALAMTGNVTADGKVRKIGGVAAKIRAGTNAECKIVALPADNYEQVADAMVYEGSALLQRIQVIGIATLDSAAAVARADRKEDLATAIKLFAEVQATLKKSPEQIRSKAVKEKLAGIVTLEPNHFSAKLLALVSQDKQARRLTSGATLYYLAVAIKGVTPALEDLAKATDRQKVPPAALTEGIKTMDRLRRIADPKLLPLLDAYREFVRAVADAQAGSISIKALEGRVKAVSDAEARFETNRDLMEKLLREGV